MPFFNLFSPVKVAKTQEAEEELIDPQTVLRASCNETSGVAPLKARYEACNDRVNSRSRTTEICVEEINDYFHALDTCVAKTLFSQLK